ncbi:hypothetical protein FAM23868_002002 [Propionibacterium freudenreichii]|uniref:gp53-like domain-containing protein n=1 Tax=Propionibacterium freudenreichii TaxID=1744 RepID=UPI00254A1336|nr:hypothetical protein [Propionibacterium freudenreichii]MDK9332662.1 hypothetical protein [Propionibacterium freudenreichii]
MRPGIELRVWDAEVAGKAVAVQQDRGDGWVLVSRVLTDDVGRYRFRTEAGPTVWVEDASGRRWRQDAWQTLGTMIDSAQTAVTVSQAASSTADKALDTATRAASAAASAASSASAAQTAAAASATDAAASATIAQGAQIAANIGNSWWMTGNGTPPTTFGVADGLLVGARFRDTTTGEIYLASQVLEGEEELTVTWEQIGPIRTAATETALLQMPATLGAIGLVTTTGARWMRRASGWVAETGPWTSTSSWTWGNGFHPAAPWNHLPTVMYRLVDFGRRVQMRGLIARDSGSGDVAMVNVPAELRPTSPYQSSIQTSQIVGQGGNIKSAIGVTEAEWISLEWELGSELTVPLPPAATATVVDRPAKIVNGTLPETIVLGQTNPMGTALPGGIPPAGSRFIVQAGSAVATANAAGDFFFNWPEAFPTAILSVQLTSGENVAHNGAIALRPATTLTTCHACAAGNATGAVRCDYIAIGY